MEKETKSDYVLSLMALSSGGIRKKIIEEEFGGYGRRVLTELEKKGYIKTKKAKPIFVYLTQKGMEYIEEKDVLLSSLCLRNTSRTSFLKIYISNENDGIKYSAKSDTMLTLEKGGISIMPKERGVFGEEEMEVAGFSIREVKHAIDPKYQLASGSVCHGVMLTPEYVNLIYHFENGQININQTVEENLKEAIENELEGTRKTNLIAIDFDYNGLQTIFRNSVINEKGKRRAKNLKTNYVSNLINKDLDFEEKYYVPSGAKGVLYLKAIVDNEKTRNLIEYAAKSKRVSTGGIQGLGFAEDEREIITLFPITFSAICRLMSKKNKEKAYCVIALKSAVEELEKLIDNENIEWIMLEDEVIEKMYAKQE